MPSQLMCPVPREQSTSLSDDEARERAQVDALLARYGIPETRITAFRAPYPS